MNNNFTRKLALSLLGSDKASESFIQSLDRPSVSSSSNSNVNMNIIERLLKKKSEEAYALYKNTKKTDQAINIFDKLIYTLVCISDDQICIEEKLRLNIKKAALGFEIEMFNPIQIYHLKDQVNYALYSIISQIYSKSLIYKKIKIENQNPVSQIHKKFLQKCSIVLRKYEKEVLSTEDDIFSFHCKMYLIYQELDNINSANEIIKERRYFINNNSMSFSMSKASECLHSTYKNIPLLLLNQNSIDPDILEYKESIFEIYSEITKDYLLSGTLNDPKFEYFIKDNVLDYGLIPPFISNSLAEIIAYTGKYTSFLKDIGELAFEEEIVATIHKLDISKSCCENKLNIIFQNLNTLLYENFVKKYNIYELLQYFNNTFLFGRGDFIENLFVSLKESRKFSKKNIVSILEESLEDAFPGSPFNSLMDIYMGIDDCTINGKNNINHNNDSRNSGLCGFSLYCRLSFPISFLLEEDFVIKLSYIFNFLWKLKRVDHLCRKLGNQKYTNLTHRLMYYVFYEVIGSITSFSWNNERFAFDDLKKEIKLTK